MNKDYVLLAVAGMTPQIITETLYGIYQKTPEKLPRRVKVITSQAGEERLIKNLLGDDSPLKQLIADYNLPEIAFSQQDILVPKDRNGQPLNDVQSEEDQAIITDFITEQVRRLSQQPDIAIHASLAGGRKTMGFALGYAMSLFGRPCDCLSHVLVNEPYETIPDFYYPTPYTVMRADRSKSTRYDLSQAKVMLANIPLVMMREEMPQDLIKRDDLSYTETVNRINQANAITQEQASVVLDYSTMTIFCDGLPIPLQPINFAFYSWMAKESREFPGEGVEPASDDMSARELDKRLSQLIHAATSFDSVALPSERDDWDLVRWIELAEETAEEIVKYDTDSGVARKRWLFQGDGKDTDILFNSDLERPLDELRKRHKNLWNRLLKETNKQITDKLGKKLGQFYTINNVHKRKVNRAGYVYKGLTIAPDNIQYKNATR